MGTYGHIPTISLLLAFHYVTVNVGNNGLGVHDRRMSIYCKFGLKTDGQICDEEMTERTLKT